MHSSRALLVLKHTFCIACLFRKLSESHTGRGKFYTDVEQIHNTTSISVVS